MPHDSSLPFSRAASLSLMRRIHAAHSAAALPVLSAAAPLPPRALADEERLALQRESIVETLRRERLASPRLSLVEFGAGDASLSREAWRAAAAGRFCVVDRKLRAVGEAGVAGEAGEGFRPRVLCADVSELEAEELCDAVEPGEGGTVVLSNHLCGRALDESILLSVDAWHRSSPGKLAGVFAVTCCHDRCLWRSYLGKSFLKSCGLDSAVDFEQMRRWTKMAPRRNAPAEGRVRVVREASRLGISCNAAAQLGSQCREILDTGRALYLQALGFEVRMVQHVDFRVTADCVMIQAVHRSHIDGASSDDIVHQSQA